MSSPRHPQRIVCLTAETTEIAFALGAGDRVVGVSGYALRPPEARRKPRVSAFTSVNVEKVLALRPDLVLSFSDLQAEAVRQLVHAGLTVLSLNQRTLQEALAAIHLIGGVLGCADQAERLASEMEAEIAAVRRSAAQLPRRPRVYFEEWDDPLISGIGWVSEIIEAAGGQEVFPELRRCQSALGRVVDPAEVVRRNPEVILVSWCGKKFVPRRLRARPGWETIEAVARNHVCEIKAPDILQPGPSLLRGLRQVHQILRDVAAG